MLTELSTGGSEPLTVRVNTLTTVVVINYVEPEGEQPAAIDVVKYTCAPGFQGRVWLDFAEACLDDANRTNNVGFRLSGAVSARRVTGDTGIGGATRFDGLPSGDYQLREESPLGTVAVYAFCGVDPTSPDGRGVGDAVNLRLASGQTVTCHWFNVPEDLAGDTGAITVYKYACPVTVRRRGSIGMAAAIRKARESSSVCRSGMARDSCRSSPGRRMATDSSLYPAATGHL